VVVEGARGDAEELGDRGDGAAGVGQEVAGGADDFFGGDGGVSADPAAGAGGQSVPMEFWRRPLHAMTDAFTTVGFRLSAISEPQPDPAARELFPDGFQGLSTNPNFLFFVVEVPPSATGSDS